MARFRREVNQVLRLGPLQIDAPIYLLRQAVFQELQDTLDRDSSSLAQLECDKAEARTRLDELEQQKSKLDAMLTDVRNKVQEENENVKTWNIYK